MSRVVATLSTRRNSVTASRSEGKTANSSGLCTYIVVTSTMTEMVMLTTSRKSSTNAGSGTRITTSRLMKAMGRIIPRFA